MPTTDPTSNGVNPATNSQAQTQNTDEFDFSFIDSQDETPVEDQVSETKEAEPVQEDSSDLDLNLDLPDSYAATEGTAGEEKADDTQSTLDDSVSKDNSEVESNPFEDSVSEDSQEVDSLDSTEDNEEDKIEEDYSDDANLLDDSNDVIEDSNDNMEDSNDTVEDSSSLNEDLDEEDDSLQDSSDLDDEDVSDDTDSLSEDVVSGEEETDDLLDDDLLADDDDISDLDDEDEISDLDDEEVSDLDNDEEISDSEGGEEVSDSDDVEEGKSDDEDTVSLDEDVVDDNSEDSLNENETDEFSLVEPSEETENNVDDEADSSIDESQGEDGLSTDVEDSTSLTDDNVVDAQTEESVVSEESSENTVSDNLVDGVSLGSELVSDQPTDSVEGISDNLGGDNLNTTLEQENVSQEDSSNASDIAVDSAFFEAVGEELSNAAPQQAEVTTLDNIGNMADAPIQGQEMAQDAMSTVNQIVVEQPVVEQPVVEDSTPKTLSLDEMVSQFSTANQNNQTLMENNNQVSDQNVGVENQQGVSLDSLLQGAKSAEQAAAPQTLDLDAMSSQSNGQANPLTAPTPYPQQAVNGTKAKSTNKTLVTGLLGLLVVVLGVMAYIKYPDMFNFSGGDNTPVAVSDEHGAAPDYEDLDSLTGDELTGLEEEYIEEDELMIQMLEPVEIDETTLSDEIENIQSIDLGTSTEDNVPSDEKEVEISGDEGGIAGVQELEIGSTSDNDPLAAVEQIGVSFGDSITIKQEIMDYQEKGKQIKEAGIAETNKTKMKYGAAVEKEASELLNRIENESDIDISSVWSETKQKLDNYLQLVENV